MLSVTRPYPSWLPWLLLLAGIVLAGALGGAFLARSLDPQPPPLSNGAWLPEPRRIADFTLTDGQGRDFGLAELHGQASLLFFGFTRCPDVCPATLAQLAAVQRALPALRVVFVSVDPQHDTPEALGHYVRAFHPSLIAVTGAAEAREPLERSLASTSMRVALPDGSDTYDHSAALYLLDREARWVASFRPPFMTEPLVADLRAALLRLGRDGR